LNTWTGRVGTAIASEGALRSSTEQLCGLVDVIENTLSSSVSSGLTVQYTIYQSLLLTETGRLNLKTLILRDEVININVAIVTSIIDSCLVLSLP
jgi:hypothetical protein